MADARYRRVVLKISGESFCCREGSGIDASALAALTGELTSLREMGIQLAVVVGAGNLIRGDRLAGMSELRRVTADHMGMLATVINGLALCDALIGQGVPARVYSAIEMTGLCEPFAQRTAMAQLECGQMLILAGGTGSPFFTTDTCAALRAAELGAEVLLKATKVDGVFDADPATHPRAKKYDQLTCEKVLADRLGVMDLTAISLCMQNQIPIVVFQLDRPGNLAAAVRGEPVGTLITT